MLACSRVPFMSSKWEAQTSLLHQRWSITQSTTDKRFIILCHLKHFVPDFEVVHFCWPKNGYMRSALWAHCITVYSTIIWLLNNRVRPSENWILRTSPDSIQIQTCSGLLQKVSSTDSWANCSQRERETCTNTQSHTHTHTHICIILQGWLSPCQIVCLCRLLLQHNTQGVSPKEKYGRCDWCLNTTKFCTQTQCSALKVWLTLRMIIFEMFAKVIKTQEHNTVSTCLCWLLLQCHGQGES